MQVVCGPCSGNQAPLQYLKNDSARVCDECYQYLLEGTDKIPQNISNQLTNYKLMTFLLILIN